MSIKREKKFNNNQGFTLIELMVVIVILGILAGLVSAKIIHNVDEAKQKKARIQIEALETALKQYRLDTGSYPSTEQGLLALVEQPATGSVKKWREGGYLEKGRVPKDPWGNEFVYLSPGVQSDFDIISYGGDGVPEGSGFNEDINNWEVED